MDFSSYIGSVRLLRDNDIEMVLTTGDAAYPGTSLEVGSKDEDLFHFVVDEHGEHQVLVYPARGCYRLKLSTLEAIVSAAREKVRYVPD